MDTQKEVEGTNFIEPENFSVDNLGKPPHILMKNEVNMPSS